MSRPGRATAWWLALVLAGAGTGCHVDPGADPRALSNSASTVTSFTPASAGPTGQVDEVKEAVGPLFPAAADTHTCTAAVVASASRNIVMTAAHCISGTGRGMRFMPGYSEGASPRGIWSVTGVYADAHWLRTRDPHFDYAFLQVAPDASGRSLENSVAGLRLVVMPHAQQSVTAVGYGAGIDDEPLVCGGIAYMLDGGASDPDYLQFDCGGFVSGTSGSPLIVTASDASGAALIGLIGGLHGGGCSDVTSYSPILTGDAAALLRRASSHSKADVLPSPPGSDC